MWHEENLGKSYPQALPHARCMLHSDTRSSYFLPSLVTLSVKDFGNQIKKSKSKVIKWSLDFFFLSLFTVVKLKFHIVLKKKKSLNFFLISWLKHEDGKRYGAGANPHYCTHASSRFNCFKTLSYAIDQTSEISNLVWLVECWNPCCKWSQIS